MKGFVLVAVVALAATLGTGGDARAQYVSGYRVLTPGGFASGGRVTTFGGVRQSNTVVTPFGVRQQSVYSDAFGTTAVRSSGYNALTGFGYNRGFVRTAPFGGFGYSTVRRR